MKLLTNISAALLGIMFLAGCNEPHQPPPLDQMELTARFIRSIESGQADIAVRQGKKLLTIDPDAFYLADLIAVHEANDTIADIQNLIEQKKIDQAMQVVRDGRKKYRGNRTFNEIYPKVSQLRNTAKLFRALKRAKSSSAMRSARIAVQSGLSLNMTLELEKFLTDYEARGTAVANRERADILAAERAAREAARKSKIEEVKRRAAEKKFEQETARKSAEGERLRQNNKLQ